MCHRSRGLRFEELLQGSPSVGRFSLQEFNIWYLMMKCVFIISIFVAHWLASSTSNSVTRDHFPGVENINLLFVSCSGPSVKKQWRERQEAQVYYFCSLEDPKCRR